MTDRYCPLEAPSSNRLLPGPINVSDAVGRSFGIDTIGIRFALAAEPFAGAGSLRQTVFRSVNLQTGQLVDDATHTTGQLECGAHWRLASRHGRYTVFTEFSVPRLAFGMNARLASIGDLRSQAKRVFDELSRHFKLRGGPMDAGVRRLDVARDFIVPQPGFVAELGNVLRAKGAQKVTVIHGRAGCESAVLSSSGSAPDLRMTLYDKRREALHRRADEHELGLLCNRLRWELVMRRGTLQRTGVEVVGDITESLVYRVGRDRFIRNGFGREVLSRASLAARIGRALTRRSTASENAVGTLAVEALGLRSTRSPGTMKSHRSMWRRWGVSPTSIFANPPYTVRLDFDSGLLVASDGRTHQLDGSVGESIDSRRPAC